MDDSGLFHDPPLGITSLFAIDVELRDLLVVFDLLFCFRYYRCIGLLLVSSHFRPEHYAFKRGGGVDVLALELKDFSNRPAEQVVLNY